MGNLSQSPRVATSSPSKNEKRYKYSSTDHITKPHNYSTPRNPRRHVFSILLCALFIVYFYLYHHRGPLGGRDRECGPYIQKNYRANRALHSGIPFESAKNDVSNSEITGSYDRQLRESYTATIIYIMPEDTSSSTPNLDTYSLIISVASVYINIPIPSWPIVVFHNGQFDDESIRSDVKSAIFLNIINWSRDGGSGFGSGYGGAHSTWRAWKFVENLEFVRIEWKDNNNSNDGAPSPSRRFSPPLILITRFF